MPSLNDEQIKRIFAMADLGEMTFINKIDVGFSNDVYAIDDQYMLKIGRSLEDDESLLRDAFLCNLLHDRLPTPRIIKVDASMKLVERVYFIYDRIPGETLYQTWHLLTDVERRECIRQICSMLRAINSAPYKGYAERFNIDLGLSWQERTYARINHYLAVINTRKILPPKVIAQTRSFLERHVKVLQEVRLGLTYYDPHFDNFLVSEGRIVGMLDFERVEIASIDYVLDMVGRMARHPRKYASEATEPFVRPADYARLLAWYREFYPELFDFAPLGIRLAIYAIEASLRELFYFPASREAREELETAIDENNCIYRELC